MISAPACYGKLPMLGDYFQRGASQEQTNVWWRHFTRADPAPNPAGAAEEPPWCFTLPPGMLWPGKDYVAGAIRLSRDRIGRAFPFVIWQSVSRRALRLPLLFGKNASARNWLFWLSRLLAAYTGQGPEAGQATAPRFEQSLRRLWAAHQPGPGAWLGWSRRPPAREAYREVENMLPDQALHGVTFMPWADWPERLWAPEAPGCFWQQDQAGRYLRAFQERALGPETFLRLFSGPAG